MKFLHTLADISHTHPGIPLVPAQAHLLAVIVQALLKHLKVNQSRRHLRTDMASQPQTSRKEVTPPRETRVVGSHRMLEVEDLWKATRLVSQHIR